MKQIIWLLVLGFVLTLLLSNESGRGLEVGPATTAPGESGQFCGSTGCHSSGNFFPELEIQVFDLEGREIDRYVSGENYTVSLVINHVGFPSRYGFQIVSLKNEDTSVINNFVNIPDFIHEIELLGRQYVEHDFPLPFDSIPLSWIGPEKGTGDITFYAAANAVNGNGSPTGDGSDTTRLILKEAEGSSTEESMLSTISIFPNPAQNLISINAENDFGSIRIFDLNGRVHIESNNAQIDISGLTKGIYFILLKMETGTLHTARFMKY